MDFVKVKHLESSANYMTEKGEYYLAEAAKYAEHFPELAGWYEGRGEAFIAAANWLRKDIDVFGENIDDPIAHLIGDAQ